jgi:hypothetical protein
MKLVLNITGTRPMLQHNGRLANPIDPYTRRVKELVAKRKKTDEDLIAIMQAEARGAVYETAEGLVGFPTANVWRCIYDAAKAYKRGEDIKRSMTHDPIVEPLLIGGEHVTVDAYLSDPAHIDYRPVAVQRSKTMRARPIIAAGWQTTHTFDVLEEIMDLRDLGPIIDRAGRIVGLGDWRPIYGAFVATVEA